MRRFQIFMLMIFQMAFLATTSGPSHSFIKRQIAGTEVIIDEKGLDTLDATGNDTPHNLIPSAAKIVSLKPNIPAFLILNVGRMTDLDQSCYLRLTIRGSGFDNRRIDRDICKSGAPINNYWIINHSFIPAASKIEIGLTAFKCDSCDIEAVLSITQPE